MWRGAMLPGRLRLLISGGYFTGKSALLLAAGKEVPAEDIASPVRELLMYELAFPFWPF
jgi:hypothetical protein